MSKRKISEREMQELQRLVPPEEQVKAGLLIKHADCCFTVKNPDTYADDIRALAASSTSNPRRKDND